MFGILYQTIVITVYSAGRSLALTTPLAVFVAAVLYAHHHFGVPLEVWFALMVVLVGLVSMYLVAALRAMLHPESPPDFWDVVLFGRRHVDFLAFSAATFIVLGILIFVLIYIVTMLYGYLEVLAETAPPEGEVGAEYGYGEGGAALFLHGSQIFTVAFFIAAAVLWSIFFRIFIKMPAYIDGFEISSGEALDLTAHNRRHILVMSAVLNAAFLTVTGVLPWEELELWVRYLMVGCAVWGGLHLNLAFSVAAYRHYTEGYQMRRSGEDF